ncbi:hypothetical protein MVEN_02267800 [Mycena venus]|uniref:Uncharacterized protein n=1 Tax=Mycena venus TaxID=2733690 RepID=A0A8H6X4V6_9AGAR|nr:hypothetical protein MVEN_02267800 [Mycena venus]
MRILGGYFAIPEMLAHPERQSVGFLDEILGLRSGSVRLTLRGVHSIFLILDSDDDPIGVHHASLYDFLLDPARAGRFYLSQEALHANLAACCFSIVKNSVQNPEHCTASVSEYAHKHWNTHYIPSQEQHQMIQECLRCFRRMLSPEELDVLCCSAEDMAHRLVRAIDFLENFDTDTHYDMATAVADTWNILLTTLFDPTSALRKFYEDGIDHRFNITSLEDIFRRLWRQSSQRVTIFLSSSPSNQIRAAEISMRLLMCRNAEMKAIREQESVFWDNYNICRNRWTLANDWCTYLTQAPATAELSAMLGGLIENTLIARDDERDLALLEVWLVSLPVGLETQAKEIYTAFKAARTIPSARSETWFEISFAQE